MGTSTEAIVYYGYSFDPDSEYSDLVGELYNTQSWKGIIQVDVSGHMEYRARYFIYAWKVKSYFSEPDKELDIPSLADLSKEFDDKLADFLKLHNIVCKTKPKLYLTGCRG